MQHSLTDEKQHALLFNINGQYMRKQTNIEN